MAIIMQRHHEISAWRRKGERSKAYVKSGVVARILARRLLAAKSIKYLLNKHRDDSVTLTEKREERKKRVTHQHVR